MRGGNSANPVALMTYNKSDSFVRKFHHKGTCAVTCQKLRLTAGLPHQHLNSLFSPWQSQAFPYPEKDYQDLCRHFFFSSQHSKKLSATNELSTGDQRVLFVCF